MTPHTTRPMLRTMTRDFMKRLLRLWMTRSDAVLTAIGGAGASSAIHAWWLGRPLGSGRSRELGGIMDTATFGTVSGRGSVRMAEDVQLRKSVDDQAAT